MQTGDGLLVRITPSGRTIPPDVFSSLCSAARKHGNGIVEITSRGSLQIRGLTPSSASSFAADVAPLDLGNDGVPIAIAPLSGLDPDELVDATSLAGELRRSLASVSWVQNLGAKTSVVIDGGGRLHLDALMADVRLRAVRPGAAVCFEVWAGSKKLGAVLPRDAVETAVRLLAVLAQTAPKAHMSEAIGRFGIQAFASAVRPLPIEVRPDAPRPAEPIGLNKVRGGCALGVGLPFGHSDADTLGLLIVAAKEAGALGFRTSPGRALLILGLTSDGAASLAEKIGQAGFVVAADDPRRRVVACAGAPICSSGQIPARELAPEIARAAASLKCGVVHISGCAKGCAHHGPAALTVTGRDKRCDLVLKSRPFGTVSVEALPRCVAELLKSGHV